MILPPIYHCEKRVRCGEDSGDRFDSEDVRCVLEVTQTHIHITTYTLTPWGGYRTGAEVTRQSRVIAR